MGWRWYENYRYGYAITVPQTWELRAVGDSTQLRRARFFSPETGSIAIVEIHELLGEDWLEWAQERARGMMSLRPSAIDANVTFLGRPAFFHFDPAAGGTGDQVTLLFAEGGRLFRFYYQAGTLPPPEAEATIFQTMVESFVQPGLTGSSDLPTGWERGESLVIIPDALGPAELSAGEQQRYRNGLTGTLIAWDFYDFTLMADDGQEYAFRQTSDYHFRGLPVGIATAPDTEPIQEGEHVLVIGYLLATEQLQTQYIAVEREGEWRPYRYKSFFDLTRAELDPTLLARYPEGEDIKVYLRGSSSEVFPHLVDEESNSVDADALVGDAGQEDVLAHGWLQDTDGPRLVLEELYLRRGACEPVSMGELGCLNWQQVFPAPTPMTITATIVEVAANGVIVLEKPVQGFVTVTLAPEGQLLTEDGGAANWEELTAGMQVQASGQVDQAGTLLAQEVHVDNVQG